MSTDSLGDRMKRYEAVSRPLLMRKTPVIIRVDGRAFHTFTRHCARPYDQNVMEAMRQATLAVAKASGSRLAYTQSDEASFLLHDLDTIQTNAWFDNDLLKLATIAASTMTAAFNRAYGGAQIGDAVFDGRAFNVPLDEVANYFVWRAKDWHRNSVQMLAQTHFSPKQLHGKKQPDMHEMLHGVGVNWATDAGERERNGLFLTRDGERTDVLPHYPDIAPLAEEALRPRPE